MISLHDVVGVAQLVFASVAGAGALVALVVAYRRQRVAEATAALDNERWQATAAHDRTRVFNERFTAIAAQLGDEKPAVRLAGVHAMAGLADDWEENQQTCIDVLCAYLRMPYAPDPGPAGPVPDHLAFRAEREVRHTVIRVLTAHLKASAATPWLGMDFDFTGAVFDGGDFSGAEFSGGLVTFDNADFSAGIVRFNDTNFSGALVTFRQAKFRNCGVTFYGAKFQRGIVTFSNAEFSGGWVNFNSAEFSGGQVDFAYAKFSGGLVSFRSAFFSGGGVDFSRAFEWSEPPQFPWDGAPPAGVTLPNEIDTRDPGSSI